MPPPATRPSPFRLTRACREPPCRNRSGYAERQAAGLRRRTPPCGGLRERPAANDRQRRWHPRAVGELVAGSGRRMLFEIGRRVAPADRLDRRLGPAARFRCHRRGRPGAGPGQALVRHRNPAGVRADSRGNGRAGGVHRRNRQRPAHRIHRVQGALDARTSCRCLPPDADHPAAARLPEFLPDRRTLHRVR